MALKNARQNLFSSPDMSVKQQRLNTDQKAPRMLSELQSPLPPRVNEVAIAVKKVVHSQDLNCTTLKAVSLYPTNINCYDTYLLQRAIKLRKPSTIFFSIDLSKPHEPLQFYSIIWMMCICGNTEGSFRPTIGKAFEKFANHFSLGDKSPTKNGAATMDQIGLALLLQFLSYSNAAVEWLVEKRSCDIVTNGLLTALNDRKKNPRDLLMAVACITHTVHRHSAIGRVMTAGNSCQLVRLLLGKAIYPNEGPQHSSVGSGENSGTMSECWEVQACRLGLSRLLSIQCVLSHSAVRVEVNKFIQKWWARLQKAAAVLATTRQSASLQPLPPESHQSQYGSTSAEGTSSMSIPPAVLNALDVLSDLLQNRYPAISGVTTHYYLPVFLKYDINNNDMTPDVALLSLAFGCKESSSESASGMSFLMHFIGSHADPRAALSASLLAASILRHLRLALKQQRDQTSNHGVDSLQTHMRGLQTTAGVLAYDMFQQVLEAAHRISSGFKVVRRHVDTRHYDTHTLHTLSSVSVASSVSTGPFERSMKLFHDKEFTPSGVRNTRGIRTPSSTSRPPLSTITNTSSRHESPLQLKKVSSTTKSGRVGRPGAGGTELETTDWVRWQEIAWEPVLVDQVYLLQECASLARLRESIPHSQDERFATGTLRGALSPSQSSLVRQRVAEWIQDVDASGRCVVLSPTENGDGVAAVCRETSGGLVLVRMLFVLAHALEEVMKSAADSESKETANVVTHRICGALSILVGLLSCLVNADYKDGSSSRDISSGSQGVGDRTSAQRDEDDFVCFDDTEAQRPVDRYSSPGGDRPVLSQGSAVTVSPRDALRHRQMETSELLSFFLSSHEKTVLLALEQCGISSGKARTDDDCCGSDRCWCVDTHWPPAFWNELHIQRMMSACKRSSPKAASCTQPSTQGTLLDDDDHEDDNDDKDVSEIEISQPIASKEDVEDAKDGSVAESFLEDDMADLEISRHSFSSAATNESIELPPPPPLSTASSSNYDPRSSPCSAIVVRKALLLSDREEVEGTDQVLDQFDYNERCDDSCDTLNYKTQEQGNQSPVSSARAPTHSPSKRDVPPSSSLARTDSTGSTVGGDGVFDGGALTVVNSDRRELARISTELSKMRMSCAKEAVVREDHERRLIAAQESLQQERSKVRRLEEQLRKAEEAALCAQAREASLLEENSRVRHDLADLKIELSGMITERDECEERCRSVEGMLEEAWQKMKVIAHSEDASKKHAVKSEQQLMKCRDECLELERKLTVLNGDLRASFALTDRFQKDLSIVKANEHRLEDALRIAQETAEDKFAAARALESQVNTLQNDLESCRQKQLDMDGRAEASRAMISSQQLEIKALQTLVTQSEEKCHLLQKANRERNHEYEQLRLSAEKGRVDLQQQLAVLTNQAAHECERLNDLVAEARAQRDAIQSDLTSEMARSCKLGKSFDKQVLLTETLQNQLSGLQETERGLLRDLEGKQAECDSLNADLVKHKELISYINKLSTEAEAKRNR